MASQNSLWLLSALFIAFICSSHAIILEVGEDDGWTLNPVESYSAWAGRLRFRVNDTLHFKYNDATDSVLVVNKEDYDNCNVDNPIQRLDGGDNSFRLTEGGAHYFITGNKSNCEQGQKVDVEVLHIRTQSPPSPPPAPAPLPPAPLPPAPASPVAGPPPSTTPLLTPPSSAPTGGSSPAPVGSAPADLNTPAPAPVPSATPSSATAVVSGTITAAIVIIAMSSII